MVNKRLRQSVQAREPALSFSLTAPLPSTRTLPTPLLDRCPSPQCERNNLSGKLRAQTRGSRFLNFQHLKVRAVSRSVHRLYTDLILALFQPPMPTPQLQELPDQVPVGHIPRHISVQCRGELCRKCSPGDMVVVSGTFLPKRYQGFQAIKALSCSLRGHMLTPPPLSCKTFPA